MPTHALVLPLAVLQALSLLVSTGSAVALRAEERSAQVVARVAAAPQLVAVPPRPAAVPATRRTPVVHRPAPRPRQLQRAEPIVRRTATVLREKARQTTSASTLLRASLDRLPGYRPGDAVFQVRRGLPSWGIADLGAGRVYVSSSVPSWRMYDVVAHEWSHVLSVRAYDGDVAAALAAMRETFGGSGMTGAERAADCMAREVGARWTHYTSCQDDDWRAAARRLLARQPI